MTITSMESSGREPPVTDRITALVIAGDRHYRERVEATIGDDKLVIRTKPSVTDPLTGLDGIDCLVSEYPTGTASGDDLLERVRQRVPDLPVVFLVDGDEETAHEIVDAVRSSEWTDYVRQHTATAAAERLGHRIRTLVQRRRLDALSRRSLASVELARDAIAIVDPDGDCEFANRSYAMQFGYDRDALPGTPWQALFTDDSVERLETTAIPTVADGWRWTGTCTGRRKSGEPFDVRVRLGGLEDGALVFVVDQSAVEDATDGAK